MKRVKQKGSSTVEFALLLPVLLLLIVAISEYGVMFYRLNAVTKSVDTAARYLSDVSVNYKNTATDESTAKNLAVYGTTIVGKAIDPSLAVTDIVITNISDSNGIKHVKVVATYNANLILLNTLKNLKELFKKGSGSTTTSSMTLNASSVMRFAK